MPPSISKGQWEKPTISEGCFERIIWGLFYRYTHPTSAYIHTDGGRPYIIAKNGKLAVKQKHINELNRGITQFEDFLDNGFLSMWM